MTSLNSNLLKIATLISMISVFLLAYTNCGAIGEANLASNSSMSNAMALERLRAEKDAVFARHCTNCHKAGATDTTLHDLASAQVLDSLNLINVGSPQTSTLYLSILDNVMPPGGNTLNGNEIAILRDWIAGEGGNFDTYIGGVDDGLGSSSPFSPVRSVLTQQCTSCHSSTGGHAPNLNVDAPTLRATTIDGRPLVVPGNPSASVLFQSFSSMPQSDPLGSASPQAQAIRTWIINGALEQ